MAHLTTSDLHYNKASNCFSQEISSLGRDLHIGKQITVINPKTGNSRIFDFTHADKDGTGEDTYGWNYKSQDGIRLLIIND